MKVATTWYSDEIGICLKQLLDESYDPNRIRRGWLDRAEFSLDIIDAFISSSMKLGSNPLPALRKQFDFLDWRYVDYGVDASTQRSVQCCKDVSYCDFFWFAIDGQGWHLVLATRKEIPSNQSPKGLFGSARQIESEEEQFSRDSMIDMKYLERYLATKSLREM